MSFINDKIIKYQSFGQSLSNSEFSSMKSTLITGFNDDKDTINNCSRLFYKIKSKNKDLILCLRIYIGELNTIFITIPNSIILLYDITSEQSFEIISNYYEKLIEKKKYENTKFIVVGNKKDLIHEEDENKESGESEDNEKEESKKNLLNLENKIQKYCDEKKINLNKEISGLYGEGVMELFEETIKLLYVDIINMEEDGREFDTSISFYKNIETELNLSSTGQSYHSNEYKKEINKINKKRCCFFCPRCEIF
jgi:GTPase SAR1 family protein